MQVELIEVMHQQVQAIHRALTGDDLPDIEPPAPESPAATPEESAEVIARFAKLSAIARSIPAIAARVPPFAFTPPVDVVAGDYAVVLEVAVPGVRREDLTVERLDDALVISGVRRDGHAAQGRMFHAEIPRGPFHRVVPLPFSLARDPRVELEQGLLRIYVEAEAARDGTGSDTDTDNDTDQGSEENSK